MWDCDVHVFRGIEFILVVLGVFCGGMLINWFGLTSVCWKKLGAVYTMDQEP